MGCHPYPYRWWAHDPNGVCLPLRHFIYLSTCEGVQLEIEKLKEQLKLAKAEAVITKLNHDNYRRHMDKIVIELHRKIRDLTEAQEKWTQIN